MPDQPRSKVPVVSPCKGVCAVNPIAGHCIGCFRSLTEISDWIDMSETERDRVLAELDDRETAFWAQMDDD